MSAYKKLGTLENYDPQSEALFLRSPDKKSYKVGYTAVYIWEMLDGSTTAKNIADELCLKAELDRTEIDQLVPKVIEELAKVGLAEPVAV